MEVVRTGAAFDRVDALPALDAVVARVAEEPVVAAAADEHVVAAGAPDRDVACAAREVVGAGTAGERGRAIQRDVAHEGDVMGDVRVPRG